MGKRKREKCSKQCLKRVYFMFPITFAISPPLKSVSNSCLIVLEPLTNKTADLNRLKHSYNSHNTHDLNETLTQATL